MLDEKKQAPMLSDEQLTQLIIPKRFIPQIPPEFEGKNVKYVFDSSDTFLLTYDELVEIVAQIRKKSNKRMIPVLGTVN